MKTNHFMNLFLLLSVSCLISCQNDDDTNTTSTEERKAIVLSRTQEEMAVKNTDFALNLFKQINAKQTGNWMASPLSASYALGMLANGASGNTLDEIIATMGIGSSLDEINAFHQKLTTELKELDNRIQLGISNSIWVNDYPIYDSFKDINRNTYQAQIETLDFHSADALGIINDWVAQQTNGHIKDAIKELPREAVAYLQNALYFKGSWSNKFEEKNTKNMDFTNADGSITKVKMMQQWNFPLKYSQNHSYLIAELPYGNKAFSMTVLLPNEHKTVEECMSELTADDWASWTATTHTSPATVRFPRFELNTELDLVEVMQTMGMKEAFSLDGAAFPEMSPDNLYFTSFKQNSFLKINEEGAEAQTVISTTIKGDYYGSGSMILNVNRPFAFLISEKSTGVILFMGKINKL